MENTHRRRRGIEWECDLYTNLINSLKIQNICVKMMKPIKISQLKI